MKSVKIGVVTNSVQDEKDDIGYPAFFDNGHDLLDGSSLGFRKWYITSKKWDNLFKNGTSKICGKQPLKINGLLKETILLQIF